MKQLFRGVKRSSGDPDYGGANKRFKEQREHLKKIQEAEKALEEKSKLPAGKIPERIIDVSQEKKLADKVMGEVERRLHSMETSGNVMKQGEARLLRQILKHEKNKIEENFPFPFDRVRVDEKGKIFLHIRSEFPLSLRDEILKKFQEKYHVGTYFEL